MLTFKEAVIPHPSVDNVVTRWNENQNDFIHLSKPEQDFYYWVNYSRLNPKLFFDSVIAPVCKLYPQLNGENYKSLQKELSSAKSVSLFKLSIILNKMAMAHAFDIIKHDVKPSHNSTDGQTFADRFKKNHLFGCGGENISFGGGEPLFLLVLLYLDINIPTLGHRKALLNPNYTETGIGIAYYANDSIFIVEDFSCSQN